MTTIQEITCKSALNKVDSFLPFHWDLNPYRGCQHGCSYCFAQYSHAYLGSDHFFGEVFVKTNIAEVLDQQLSAKTWNNELINIGGIADCYQPVENIFRLMPTILRVMIKHKNPLSLVTKSSLLLRDLALYLQLAEVTSVNIGVTVITLDEAIRMIVEPYSSPSLDRFEVLEAFKGTTVKTSLLLSPILPYITDGEENLSSILREARRVGVSQLYYSVLNLRGKSKAVFLQLIQNHYPKLYPFYRGLYIGSDAQSHYKNSVKARMNQLKEEFGFDNPNTSQPKNEMGKRKRMRSLSEFLG